MVEEGCATVERPVDIARGNTAFEPGVPVQFADDPEAPVPALLTVMLSYARERAIVDLSCAEGALQLDYDIDFIVMEEPLI
jgi:hypothetical protein